MKRKPSAWSFSALSDFVNCPRQFYEKRVVKSIPFVETTEMLEGTRVHKAFEDRLADGVVLPPDLEAHEEYMMELQELVGKGYTERKVALNMDGKPCRYFGDRVWFRGVIDYSKICDDTALIVDYKTGKKRPKFDQMALSALHMFIEFDFLDTINTEFYWTKTRDTSAQTYKRADIDQMWAKFLPDLRQFVEAFQSDIWQPRESGLCHGWCPVRTCEFWRPKK